MEEKRSINYEKLRNRNPNKWIIVFLLVIFSGYAFFFLSPVLFHETPEKQVTNLNESMSFINGGLITVNDWKFSKSQNVMEVCCSVSGINTRELIIEASCNFSYRSKGAKALNAAIAYTSSDYFVAYVFNIPDDWYCVSLRGFIDSESATEETTVESYVEDEKEPSAYGYLYTCVENVKTVESIPEQKTEADYVVERNEARISFNESLIEANNKEMDKLKKSITEYEQTISEISKEKVFQISSEREKSDLKIKTLKSEIENLNNQIRKYETKNKTLQEEISEYKTLIWQIQG